MNPLFEELIANIIKNRPKNVVLSMALSSTTVADGLRKKSKAIRPNQNLKATHSRKKADYSSYKEQRDAIDGMSIVAASAQKSTEIIIFGSSANYSQCLKKEW